MTLQVYLDKNNEADGLWYVDDGITEGKSGQLYQIYYKQDKLFIVLIQKGDKHIERTISRVEIFGRADKLMNLNKKMKNMEEINDGQGQMFEVNYMTKFGVVLE